MMCFVLVDTILQNFLIWLFTLLNEFIMFSLISFWSQSFPNIFSLIFFSSSSTFSIWILYLKSFSVIFYISLCHMTLIYIHLGETVFS